MKKILFILLLYCGVGFAQGNFYTFDMSEFLATMEKSWSIGNAQNEPYFEVEVYTTGVMNLNNHTLEIMNSKIKVYGDTINTGQVIKRFFGVSEMIVYGNTLSTVEPNKDKNLLMYPNPAYSFVTFLNDYIEKIVIYDMNGKKVYSAIVKAREHRIDLNEFSKGVYVVQLWLSDKRGVFKRLIKK